MYKASLSIFRIIDEVKVSSTYVLSSAICEMHLTAFLLDCEWHMLRWLPHY